MLSGSLFLAYSGLRSDTKRFTSVCYLTGCSGSMVFTAVFFTLRPFFPFLGLPAGRSSGTSRVSNLGLNSYLLVIDSWLCVSYL
jgi:hypothetical protein